MNDIKLIGFVGKDAETRTLQNGSMVTKFTIATDDGYYNKDKQEYVKNTNWHTVIVWRKLAERKGQHIKKGWNVMVSGRLTSRIWEKEDGSKQTIVEIEANGIQQLVHQPKSSATNPSTDANGGDDDDLPF